MSKKTIRMICFGSIAFDPKSESPWEDVWLRYKVKRKLVCEGPCFVSRQALDGDIWRAERYVAQTKELAFLIGVRDLFDSGGEFAADNWTSGLPNIYVNYKHLCRRDIEAATEWYLREKGVLKSDARFRWNKPDFFAFPVSFDPPSLGEDHDHQKC